MRVVSTLLMLLPSRVLLLIYIFGNLGDVIRLSIGFIKVDTIIPKNPFPPQTTIFFFAAFAADAIMF